MTNMLNTKLFTTNNMATAAAIAFVIFSLNAALIPVNYNYYYDVLAQAQEQTNSTPPTTTPIPLMDFFGNNNNSDAATVSASSPQQKSQTGSDGNLTATINGDSFVAGDTIKINGTVAKQGRDAGAVVAITVTDPENYTVERATVSPNPTGGGFAHEFVAGIVRQFDPDGRIMRDSGNYTVRVSHTPPYIYGQEIPREIVNFTFTYKALD